MTTSSNSTAAAGTVLITGGARRLGRAMALGLAGDGWDVVIHHRLCGVQQASQRDAEQLASEVRQLGRQAWTIDAEFADPAACAALIPRARERAGELHAIINNASIFPASTLQEITAEDLHASVQVHAVAPTLLAQAFSELPEARAILNMLDSKITGPDTEHVAYHLSKRMLADLTRVMALAYAPRIAVNAIAPGPILPAGSDSAATFAELAKSVPLQRTGEPRDIALAAKFLMSCHFVTGQTLYVDGGRHMEGKHYG